ncbi:MAG: imidazole glycerol phosphate synthase subunit HisH [Parvularculaceae bacterium]
MVQRQAVGGRARVAIVDAGSGNLRSVEKALARAADEAGFAADVFVTDDPDAVASADRIVLPGVGAFRASMDGLGARDGLAGALHEAVRRKARPYLGICVGMQIMARRGLEFGEAAGLDWIPGDVAPIEPAPDRRVPHMGWNTVRFSGAAGPFAASAPADFYFVHSYYFATENASDLVGVCDYGGSLAAAVARDNLAGVQFHPEKSQGAGLRLLADFLRWSP